jgi:molybdenum cofactor cytidylyltransferase
MSRRFGSTKQLQKIDGVPMVRRAAALARAVCGEKSLLVAGFDHENIVTAADKQCQFIAINESYADGIGSSIACAARSLAPSADALLILLADQPRISEDHLNALLGAWSGDDNEIVATSFAGVQGPPILLPRSSFPKLVELDGDIGAKKLLQDSDYQVKSVKFDEAAVDIDVPEDLNQLA